MAEQRISRRGLKPNPRFSGDIWETPKNQRKNTKSTANTLSLEAAPSLKPSSVQEESSQSRSPSPESKNSTPEPEEMSDDNFDGPLSEERQIALVKKLYKDISFSGAYAGIQTIQKSLLKEKGLKISQNVIAKALNQFPSYIQVSFALLRKKQRTLCKIHVVCFFQHLPSIKKYPRAHYDVTSLGSLAQADLAFMGTKLNFNKYIGFLLVIDVFSVSKKTKNKKNKKKTKKNIFLAPDFHACN